MSVLCLARCDIVLVGQLTGLFKLIQATQYPVPSTHPSFNYSRKDCDQHVPHLGALMHSVQTTKYQDTEN